MPPSVVTQMQAVAILDILGGKPVPWYIRKTLAAPIEKRDTAFTVPASDGSLHNESGQKVKARVYLPKNRPHAPAIVLLHGVHHLGIDEPRLVAFATALANCGVRVLTPELPEIEDYHVDESSVRTIGESARWFAKQTGGPVGVVGLSFSGGLALLAASKPEYRPAFKFVFAVGSQDSMTRVTGYYVTGQDPKPDGTVEVLPPHPYGPLVLEYEYVEDFVPAGDVASIQTVLRAHLYEDRAAEEKSMAQLTPTQRDEARRLMDTTSAATKALIAASNKRHGKELAELSPDGRLAKMTVPVYLLHGEADNIIPSAETLWMASEIPRRELKGVLVSPVISHIDFDGKGPTGHDQWKLMHFFAKVLQAAKAKH